MTATTHAVSPIILFTDSWGGRWQVCSPDHPEAKAFGPRGAAREIPIRTTAEDVERAFCVEVVDLGSEW